MWSCHLTLDAAMDVQGEGRLVDQQATISLQSPALSSRFWVET